MNVRVAGSDTDEPTAMIQAPHFPEIIWRGSPQSVTGEITSTMSFLVTSAASGSPKTGTKLLEWLVTVGM